VLLANKEDYISRLIRVISTPDLYETENNYHIIPPESWTAPNRL
jgi:hypothetical protein